MYDFQLTAQQIAKLKREQRQQRDKRLVYRLNAIILLDILDWRRSED